MSNEEEIVLNNLKLFCDCLDLKNNSVTSIKDQLDKLNQNIIVEGFSHEIEDKFCSDFVKYLNIFLEKIFPLVKTNALPKADAECDDYSKIKHPHCFVKPFCDITNKLLNIVKQVSSKKNYTNGIHSYYIILITLIYNSTESPWSCQSCHELTQELKNQLLKVFKYETLQEMLLDVHNRTYFQLLQLLTSFLSRNNWKQNPAFCEGFTSLIKLLKYETLNSTLHMIFPVILLMIDDHNIKFVTSGLDALKKLLNEIPATDIRVNGRALVIYDALSKKLYVRDANVLDKTLTCMLKCLSILERDPKKSDLIRKLTKYDETFQVLLSNIAMFSEQDLLSVLWKHLYNYISVMDITISRHSKELVELIAWHLEIGHLKHLPHILAVIELLVSILWHRFLHFVPIILKPLLKLLLTYSSEKSEDKQQITMKINSCILTLSKCDNNVTKSTINQLGQKNEEWKTVLSLVTEKLNS